MPTSVDLPRRLCATLAWVVFAALPAQAHARNAVRVDVPQIVAATQPVTLAEAVRHATRHAPQALEADAAVRAADAAVDVAALRPNPTLSMEAENIAGSGTYAGGAAHETTVAVAMPIELGGKRQARVRVAEAERRAVAVGADALRAEAVFEATAAFVAVAGNERRLELAREREALAEAALRVARLRVREGKASPIEEQRADLVRLQAAVAAERAQRLDQLARASLARLTGLPATAVIAAPWYETVDGDSAPTGPPTPAPPPALALADAEVAAAAARVDAARRDRVPTIEVAAGLRHAVEPGDVAAVLGVTVPLPVFDTGRAEVARVQAELDRAQARRRTLQQQLEGELDAARADVENALALARVSTGPALDAAREAARIARIGYAAGKFPQLELIEAERALADTRGTAIDALSALHDARARLARLEGRTAPIVED